MSGDLVSRLHDEAMRLSGQSIDRGCVDSGIASNLADAAADALTEARAEIEAKTQAIADMARQMYEMQSELSTLRARVREVVGPFASTDLLECKDCVDNDGEHYQSQWLADALRAARQLKEEVK